MSRYPETEQRIREAAFRALAEHGYADLSIKDIGEELRQNPSITCYYFDSKDQLLLSMLDVFVEIFIGQRTEQPITDAKGALERFDRIDPDLADLQPLSSLSPLWPQITPV